MYTNADGICSKLPEFKDRIQTINPDIICITETKLEAIITDEALGLVQYNIWRKERKNKEGGGIMILIKKRTHSNRSRTYNNYICRSSSSRSEDQKRKSTSSHNLHCTKNRHMEHRGTQTAPTRVTRHSKTFIAKGGN